MNIDKNVPIPDKNRRSVYPFDKMVVGDSIKFDTYESFRAARQAAIKYKNKNIKTFNYTTKEISNTEYRIWRIAVEVK